MDKTVLENIVIENTKTIFAYFLNKGVNENDASDLTQDTILAILKSSDNIKNENAIYGYIYSIANNLYKKYLIKKKQNSYIELDENYSYKYEAKEIIDDEKIELLKRELSLLSNEYRQCVVLYYFKHNSLKDVSEKLNISLEMAKYYLFKTRKKLKEGMNMNREFGRRSYDPDKFYFSNLYYGNYNSDLEHLFNRKIVGNILLACYYTPMTLLELAIELGVANVYLEDEVNILLSYNLLVKNGNKYQTNWLILTTEFLNDFVKASKKTIENSFRHVFEHLDELKAIPGISQNDVNNNDFKWSLLPLLLNEGFARFDKEYKGNKEFKKVFKSANTISYGMNIDYDNIYQCKMIMGYTPIIKNYGASVIVPNVFNKEIVWEEFEKEVNNNPNKFVVVNDESLTNECLDSIYDEIKILYVKLYDIMKDTLIAYSPKNIHSELEGAIYNILNIQTRGIICYHLINSNILEKPSESYSASILYKK